MRGGIQQKSGRDDAGNQTITPFKEANIILHLLLKNEKKNVRGVAKGLKRRDKPERAKKSWGNGATQETSNRYLLADAEENIPW